MSRTAKEHPFVRFENKHGDGIFTIAQDYWWEVCDDHFKINRKERGQFAELWYWLAKHTPAPPSHVYVDRRTKWPETWFKRSSPQWWKTAFRLYQFLNRHGADIWLREASDPGKILWEDAVQVVARPHRRTKNLNHGAEVPKVRRRARRDRMTIRKGALS